MCCYFGEEGGIFVGNVVGEWIKCDSMFLFVYPTLVRTTGRNYTYMMVGTNGGLEV